MLLMLLMTSTRPSACLITNKTGILPVLVFDFPAPCNCKCSCFKNNNKKRISLWSYHHLNFKLPSHWGSGPQTNNESEKKRKISPDDAVYYSSFALFRPIFITYTCFSTNEMGITDTGTSSQIWHIAAKILNRNHSTSHARFPHFPLLLTLRNICSNVTCRCRYRISAEIFQRGVLGLRKSIEAYPNSIKEVRFA